MTAVAGRRLLAAEITEPRIGAWHADLEYDPTEPDEAPIAGRVDFDVEGVAWSGTVIRAGLHGGRGRARIVGGAGGLSRELAAKNYAPSAGVKVSAVLGDILREAGETLSPAAESGPLALRLPKWHRAQPEQASHALVRLLDAAQATFRVMRDGTIWVGRASYPDAPTFEHTVVDEDWAAGITTIAPAAPTLEPGVTFRGQPIELVVHRLTGARLRTEAYLTSAATSLQRFLGHIRSAIDYSRPYPARVSGQNADQTLSLVADDARMKGAGLAKVPIRRGLPGITTIEVPAGARCTLEFEGGDPARPIVTAFEPGGVTLVKFDNGTKDIARVDDEVEITIPASTFLVTAQAGVPNAVDMVFTGKINTGNPKLKA